MRSDNAFFEKKSINAWQLARQHFIYDTPALIGLYGVILLCSFALFGPWLAPYPIEQQFLHQQLLPPAWSTHGDIAFFLGTDDLGRDMLSRLLAGSRATFGGALIVMLAATVTGTLLGILAATYQGLRAAIYNHIFDIFIALPSILIAILITAFSQASLLHAMLAVYLALLPRVLRMVYDAVYDELHKEYALALQLDGIKQRDLLKHILPNIIPLLVTESTRTFSFAILDLSALGFLMLGAQSPAAEWGSMLGTSLELIYVAPWTVTLPGIAITLSVIFVNLLGNGIRRAIMIGAE